MWARSLDLCCIPSQQVRCSQNSWCSFHIIQFVEHWPSHTHTRYCLFVQVSMRHIYFYVCRYLPYRQNGHASLLQILTCLCLRESYQMLPTKVTHWLGFSLIEGERERERELRQSTASGPACFLSSYELGEAAYVTLPL